MDNVTHTLVGLIVGEAVAAHRSAASTGLAPRTRRDAIVAVSLIGSNSPDLDLLTSLSGSGSANIHYMLWHRGYTHTLPGCAFLALILYGCAEIWLRARRLKPSRSDRVAMISAAFIATFLHLLMDYFNSYGVHPFWPADNRWHYGDSVFIVEPLYWIAAAPLFFLLRSRIARVLYSLSIIGVLAAGLAMGMIAPLACLIMAAVTLSLLPIGRRLRERGAALLSVVLALVVTGMFLLAGRSAALRAEGLAQGDFPKERVIDHVLTPAPANPFCWDLWLLSTRGDRYIARHAALGLAPGWQPAAACRPGAPREHSAPLDRVSAAGAASVLWIGEFSMSQAWLRQDLAHDCAAQAFALFARAPFVAANILGDLRFDRDRARGSFEVSLPADSGANPTSNLQNCPRAAPWIAPRAELLQESDPG